jgi:hypothetical protein
VRVYTHEVVQEEDIVERETRIVKCERLALALIMRVSGNEDLSDARIFKLGTCFTCKVIKNKLEQGSATKSTLDLLVEMVEQAPLVIHCDDLERCGRDKVAHPTRNFIQ